MKREVMGLIVKRDDGSEIINYDDSSFPTYVYKGWLKPNVTWERVPHFHEDIEMVTVTSGTIAYSVNGKTIVLHEGDTIFVNSNQIHYSMSITEEIARYIIFIFNPSIISTSLAVEMNAVRPITGNHDLTYLRFNSLNEFTQEIAELMVSLPDIRRDPFQITKTLFSIWDIILKQSTVKDLIEENGNDAADTHSKFLKQMMFYIQNNFRDPITLDDFAGNVNISRSLCNKIFKQYAQESPIGYVMHFRARKAAELLRSSNMSLTEIAEHTGFNGASYMSEIFKKYFNTSPAKYRKNWTNPNNTGEPTD